MKVLVTGGAGFIGSHLVDALVAQGDEVTVVDDLVTGYRNNLTQVEDKITFIEANVGDKEVMMKCLQDIDMVFHEAAITSVPRSMNDPEETFSETMAASFNVLECSRQCKVKRFIYATSSSAYGNRQEKIKSEDLYPVPISPYAASKLSLEMFATAYSGGFGLTTVGLRYFNVFGPRQDPKSDYAAVIPLFIRKILAGEAPMITGDGNQSRDFTYVTNVVQANLLAMRADIPDTGTVLNVATGQRIDLPHLVSILNQVAGTDLAPLYGPERPGDVRHSLADIHMAEKILGYSAKVGFEEGIKNTWEYAKGHW